jgi:hypothetical protein
MQSIATSTAQSDAGMFELNFRDERYLPFEGAGAISRWRFELPKDFRQFDYESISDLVLHMRYTARDGGATLREAATADLKKKLKDVGLQRMFSARHEFPNQWHRFVQPSPEATRTLTLPLSKNRFPYFTTRGDLTVTQVKIVAPGAGADVGKIGLAFVKKPEDKPLAQPVELSGSATTYTHTAEIKVPVRPDATDEWTLTVPAGAPSDFEKLDDLYVVCEYGLELPEEP